MIIKFQPSNRLSFKEIENGYSLTSPNLGEILNIYFDGKVWYYEILDNRMRQKESGDYK